MDCPSDRGEDVDVVHRREQEKQIGEPCLRVSGLHLSVAARTVWNAKWRTVDDSG